MKSEQDEKRDTIETQGLLAHDGNETEKGADGEEREVDLTSPTTPTTAVFLDSLGAGKSGGRKSRSTPLPYLQVFIVGCFRLAQPLCFNTIMPYINFQLVHDLKVADETTVGYYSGIIETSASVSLALGVLAWSKLSDRHGRKPVITIGGGLACVLSIAFGFARSFWVLAAARFALGLALAAQASTAKVMMAEMTDESNTAKGFALLGMAWQVGGTIAPMLGGILAKPADTWPSLFAGGIYDAYPYALPSVATALVPAIGFVLSLFFLDETHPRLKKGARAAQAASLRPKLNARDSNYPPIRISTDSDTSFQLPATPKSPRPLLQRVKANVAGLYTKSDKDGIPGLFTCGLDFLLVLWLLLLVQVVGILVAELLLFFASPKIGGLGLSQGSMAGFLTVRPFFMVLYEVNVFPRLSKRFGNEKLFSGLICIPVLTSALYLLVSHLAMNGSLDGANHPVATVFVLGISLILQVLANPVFLAADVLIPSRAPHSSQLSTVNAWGEIIAQVGISLGALGASSTFAFSAGLGEGNPWKGRLVWVCVFLVCAGTALLAQKLTKREGYREREEIAQGDVDDARGKR